MMKVVWILVVVGHTLFFLVFSIAYIVDLISRGLTMNYVLGDLGGIALFVGVWSFYLIALLGSRVKGDTLLGLSIQARKAELRRRIRELDDSEP